MPSDHQMAYMHNYLKLSRIQTFIIIIVCQYFENFIFFLNTNIIISKVADRDEM